VPRFPLFIDLENSLCVVVGGGIVALRKSQTLLDFGARITLFDPDPHENIETLALEQDVDLILRPYGGPGDIENARLVIAATGDRETNRRVSRDARALGIPVNVADDPEICTFFFPAIVRRGELVAGLSSSGSCPRFTARLKQDLENRWPSFWGDALEALERERRRLRKTESPEEVLRSLDEIITRLLEADRQAGDISNGV
jgi:siroheme synthase-like protein